MELPEAREILYNIGGVHYRQGDLEKAAALYKSILESPDPALATRAAYNMGNTLFQGEEYSAAAEAFKAALKIDPGDEDASYNYELARKMIQQQQQEKEQEQKPEQQEEQEKEQQQQEEQEKEKDQDQEKEQKQEGSPPPSPAPQASPQEEQPAPPTEEKEMDPEDLKRLLNAMLSEEEEQRDEVREKLQGEPQETWKDW
ncbi:MAG: hypothetical protein APR56_12480 [Methanosaeta sp. SDB]|nr:MAG: hypothetical protein APR56_12480 [Methanosaeta sp. SDB]